MAQLCGSGEAYQNLGCYSERGFAERMALQQNKLGRL
jgi:hypothetical protein